MNAKELLHLASLKYQLFGLLWLVPHQKSKKNKKTTFVLFFYFLPYFELGL